MIDYMTHDEILDMVKRADYQRFIYIHPSNLAQDQAYWIYRAVLLYRMEHQSQDILPKELNTIFFMRNNNHLIKRLLGVSRKFRNVLDKCHEEAVIRSNMQRKLKQRKLATQSNREHKKEQMFIARIALMRLGAKA